MKKIGTHAVVSLLYDAYCRCSMMAARERKPKREACLGGHWGKSKRAARALGLSVCAFEYFIDSLGKLGSTT
jgi:hypothetical protein